MGNDRVRHPNPRRDIVTDKTQEFQDLEQEMTAPGRAKLKAEVIREVYAEAPEEEKGPLTERAEDLIVAVKEDAPGVQMGLITAIEILGSLDVWAERQLKAPVPQGFLHDADFSDEPEPEQIVVVPEGESA
jgi:hypothetical protein